MLLFAIALGTWIVAVPMGLLKPSITHHNEEFILIRKQK